MSIASLALALAVAGAPTSQAASTGAADGDLSGVWFLTNYKSSSLPAEQRIPLTIEGAPPPLRPEAQKVYDQRIADSDRGQPYAPTSASCLPLGMPLMMMAANMGIQIIQQPKQVSMLFEEQHTYRVIPIDAPHAPDPDPTWYGDSVGHWDGDVLVVDTIGLNGRTTLDLTGLPHSEDLHVTERIRRIDAKTLEDLITIDDPKTFTRPWTTRMRYGVFTDRPMEYVCENNRNMPTADNHVTFQRPK